METIHPPTLHRYIIHGYGNSIGVQARLAPRGNCYHAEWEPGPPSWRLSFDSILSRQEVEKLLGGLMKHYELTITELPAHVLSL